MRSILVFLVCIAFTNYANADEIDPTTGLIVADGWQLVRIHCGGCHSHALVTGQRADRQTWLDIIRWMQATQNLWQFDQPAETGILDYLSANYPPQINRRRAPIPPSLRPINNRNEAE